MKIFVALVQDDFKIPPDIQNALLIEVPKHEHPVANKEEVLNIADELMRDLLKMGPRSWPWPV